MFIFKNKKEFIISYSADLDCIQNIYLFEGFYGQFSSIEISILLVGTVTVNVSLLFLTLNPNLLKIDIISVKVKN